MLGCYVGPSGIAARGVPARFLDPSAPKESSPKPAGTVDESKSTDKDGEAAKTAGPNNPTPAAASTTPVATPAAAPAPVTVGASDAMDIDK